MPRTESSRCRSCFLAVGIGFALVLVTQPIHSLCVSLQDVGRLGGMDWGVALVILLTWEAAVVGLFWWFWRQME